MFQYNNPKISVALFFILGYFMVYSLCKKAQINFRDIVWGDIVWGT